MSGVRMAKKKNYTKKQRLAFYRGTQTRDDYREGFEESAARRLANVRKMAEYERQAEARGVPVATVITEDIDGAV